MQTEIVAKDGSRERKAGKANDVEKHVSKIVSIDIDCDDVGDNVSSAVMSAVERRSTSISLVRRSDGSSQPSRCEAYIIGIETRLPSEKIGLCRCSGQLVHDELVWGGSRAPFSWPRSCSQSIYTLEACHVYRSI
jgi:hypothetical protein